MRCKTCHYSLANLTGPPHRCPECGAAFDPLNPNTFETPRPFWSLTRNEMAIIVGGLGFFWLWKVGMRAHPSYLVPYQMAFIAMGTALALWIVLRFRRT